MIYPISPNHPLPSTHYLPPSLSINYYLTVIPPPPPSSSPTHPIGVHPTIVNARSRLYALGGDSARVLFDRLTHFDPSRRISMHEALLHPIFLSYRSSSTYSPSPLTRVRSPLTRLSPLFHPTASLGGTSSSQFLNTNMSYAQILKPVVSNTNVALSRGRSGSQHGRRSTSPFQSVLGLETYGLEDGDGYRHGNSTSNSPSHVLAETSFMFYHRAKSSHHFNHENSVPGYTMGMLQGQ